jgi:hypothetical protein
MDWKEGAKWLGVLVAAGAISAVIELIIENHFKGIARAEARTEVDRVVSAALERMAATQAQARVPIREPVIIEQPRLDGKVTVMG